MENKDDVMIVKASSIKQIAHENGVSVSKDFTAILNRKILDLLEKAIERCNANNRKTLKPLDI